MNEQDQIFIKRIAKKIHESGFTTPAVFFLEMTKPLALLGSHLFIFLGPVINSIIQSDNYYRSVQVFEEPENIEILLTEIESIEFKSKKNKGVINEG
ncbi:MAG: hypothetical protein ACKVHA_05805 [Fidelibacterota bacterium]